MILIASLGDVNCNICLFGLCFFWRPLKNVSRQWGNEDESGDARNRESSEDVFHRALTCVDDDASQQRYVENEALTYANRIKQ